MKVKVRLSATRKFMVVLEDDTLGALKDHIRKFVRDTYHEDVREPLGVSLNGKDVLAGGDDTPLASLGVVQGDLLSVVQPDTGAQQAPSSARSPQAPPAPKEVPKESPKPESEQKPPTPAPASQHPAQAGGGGAGGDGAMGGTSGEGSEWRRELLMEAVDGCAPPALEQLLGECGPARLSGALNLVLHLTMLECGFQLDGAQHPPSGWAETVAVFPYHSAAHPDFRCKLVLMDVGREKQVMASFPEQAGEVKHSLVMEDHFKGLASGHVAAKDLVGVAQLSRRLRDTVLLPLQVAAHQTLGVPAPWHLAGLPQELVLAVAMRLDYLSVVALANTCRRLRTVLADNRLWHDLFERDFPGQEAGVAGVGSGEGEWRAKYKEAVRRQKEREKLLKEGTFVIPGVYPTGPYIPPHRPGHPNPFVPPPWGPGPFPPQPNPFMDPDSPYFPGEIPPVPGVYPEVPDPLGPLGPLRPGHPHQPPLMPPGRPRNPRGPRFDFFL